MIMTLFEGLCLAAVVFCCTWPIWYAVAFVDAALLRGARKGWICA
jgi:hypothetical protein